ncbi:protein PHYTOCHROME-DEPENDENT LATE-FLOWERING-like isoform X2 [Telopea speciosissima]|uniref:protein PHYTOCHROME-DEPENDENT LATE-FLOWERING-like isoform X2 n=1 Tax=Telopea speciosissima TaxID=54955 RepID=UPI001CC498BD|nr:protein PHYTOCHROME-DEPENDENT LATE-FLOWERING-like isoform X2 [Telopea speciosissima]
MGISFKVAKTGTRFRPKPPHSEIFLGDGSDNSKESSRALVGNESNSTTNRKPEADTIEAAEEDVGISGSSMCSRGDLSSSGEEVSFTLNLYPDGYSIAKPSEGTMHPASLQDISKLLHPYDRTSESLFSAIESGQLPGDILDDIPSKYFDGTLVCEVRDYRKCASEPGSIVSSVDRSPIVNKVRLRMSLENVVKDIPLISDDSWTYSDLMEVESRILKALQPQLRLDPTPMLDRLCVNPVPSKLNLGLSGARKRRLRQMPDVTVLSNNQTHGKKVCIDRVPESSNFRSRDSEPATNDGNSQQINESITAQNIVSSSALGFRYKSFGAEASAPVSPLVSHQAKYQLGIGYPRTMQDCGAGTIMSSSGASPTGQDLMIPYTDSMNSGISSFHGKRENENAQLTSLSNVNKRARQTPVVPEGIQQQQLGQQFDSLHGTDIHWKSTLLQQQSEARGIQYASTGAQKYPAPVLDGVPNHEAMVSPFYLEQPGMRFGVKEERIETDKLHKPELDRNKNDSYLVETETNQLDAQQLRLQQRLPQHPFMRSHFPQGQWHNQLIEKDSRKEDQLQKRKTVQSPRVSGGPLVQSPASSKSGEFSSGSLGPQFGAAATTAAVGSLTKEKTTAISGVTVGGAPSATSSPNDPMQQQHQAPVKRKSNSLPKTPAMSGVASPASVSNISVPLNEKSPSVGTPPLVQVIERFSKIEAVTMRHQLGCKKNKVDDHPAVKKPMVYSTQQLSFSLSNVNNEDLKDAACERPLSKSFIGGSMNICKTRVLTFLQTEHRFQGNVVHKARSRLIMSEKPNGGTVAMYHGDIDDADLQAAEDYLPTLPNTHYADLLASQFCLLMTRDGYQLAEDQLRPKPTHMIAAPNGQSTANGNPDGAAAEIQQYAEQVSGQPSNAMGTPTNSGTGSLNSSQNLVASTRMIPPGNNQALQFSQGFLPGVAVPARPQQLDPQQPLQQQNNQHSLMQQQHAQFQRSTLMLPTNPLSHLNAIRQNSNMQMPNQMVNKSSHFPLQLLQQQQQQQLQQQSQQQLQQQAQQPQPQMPRKMIMGLGTAMGMGNMGNNMGNLGGLANVMGMGSVRGMGGAAISSPMGAMSSMGNMGQNPISPTQASNISNVIQQQLRSGNLSQVQAAAMQSKLRMGQSRAGMLGGGPQAGITGIPGTGQMHPGSAGLSMLGQTRNRASMSSLQRNAMASMGPPKMISGPNFYVNQQQQQQQQLQLQQQQIQHQLQQQQQISSSLQAVVSPPQVGSPVAMAIQQQMNQSPQQMNQQTPMSPQQLSSGALQPISAGNAGAGPASPQLSSQTLGSVSSITSSPMELQGVNKSNSVGNL